MLYGPINTQVKNSLKFIEMNGPPASLDSGGLALAHWHQANVRKQFRQTPSVREEADVDHLSATYSDSGGIFPVIPGRLHADLWFLHTDSFLFS